MLTDQDIVILTYADWFAVKSTPQHISRLLAKHNRVLLVDVPRSFLRFLKPLDPLGGDQWEGPRLREVMPNLTVYHPPQRFLPVGGLPFRAARHTLLLNGRILGRQVRQAMHAIGFESPILWSFSPLHGGAIAHVPHRLLVHDICDEWTNYLSHRGGQQLVDWIDCRLSQQANVVFVFSQHMREKRASLNPETHVVLPAGDVPLYSRAAQPDTVIPEDLAVIPRPRIGAICVIDAARFDCGLVESLALRQPNWSLVFLGPAREGVDLSSLHALPNVYMMGNRSRDTLPNYLKGFDVALVPYAINEATRGIYPMKLHEYLAGGKPVVCPPLPECLHLQDVVRFAADPVEFEAAIAEVLATDSPELARQRQAVAQSNSWEHRMEIREAHVERLLALEGSVPQPITLAQTPHPTEDL